MIWVNYTHMIVKLIYTIYTIGHFWKENSTEFPILSKLAREILALPASSAENERMFSLLRGLITNERESLTANTIEKLAIARSLMELQ